MRIGLATLLSTVVLINACKKEDTQPSTVDEQLSPSTGTRTELTLDSIFLYARQVYLWNSSLPSYSVFNPRERYINTKETTISVYRQELFDITQYAINPSTAIPYEGESSSSVPRYSFLQENSGSSGLVAATTLSNATAVAASGIFEVGSTKIAYLALDGFPLLSDCKTTLDSRFADFSNETPSIAIIDLRNNPGGYVETAEYVANLLAPPALNSKLMYSERFNTNLQNGTARILQFQPYLDSDGNTVQYQGRLATMADVDYTEANNSTYFSKVGSLESIEKIYFIVSESTASAAELLISSLKPHLPCVLVGQRTYGKPVGFFPIIIDQYQLYLASFSLHNAEGWGDYYNGMEVDIEVTNMTNNMLGNPSEVALQAVLADIQANSVSKTMRGNISKTYRLQSTTNKQQKSATFIPIISHKQKLKF
ncbi:S41 family peptidase [Sphingobacterium sp. LRF_L2]|uniref:S41 family peptidase n=1 Tax=Sphingobacterium sp. LRF_L2 TaxID=3369421 RepID=UPI003F615503